MHKEQEFKPCWQKSGNAYYAVATGVEKLPAGVYTVYETSKGMEFWKIDQFKDEIFNLPGLPNELILNQVQTFWENGEIYKKHNFVHKRGILLYGPPGNGKSAVISSLIAQIINEDGLIISIDKFSMAVNALNILRSIEPKRKLMTLMEDMDTLLSGDYKAQEPYALSMLDGQAQINGVLHVATTNYPELLADRFIKRPGRFDLLIGMGNPIAATRQAYFEHILGKAHKSISYLTDKTEGLSLAYLKEIASTYLCLGIPVEESVNRLRGSFKNKIKVSKAATTGFKVGYDEELAEVASHALSEKKQRKEEGVAATAMPAVPELIATLDGPPEKNKDGTISYTFSLGENKVKVDIEENNPNNYLFTAKNASITEKLMDDTVKQIEKYRTDGVE